MLDVIIFFSLRCRCEGGPVKEELVGQYILGRNAISGNGILPCLMNIQPEHQININVSVAYVIRPEDRLVSVDLHHEFLQTNLPFTYLGIDLAMAG